MTANLPALATYLYAGALVALFMWWDLAISAWYRPLWNRLLWCLLMLLTWPVWGLLAVAKAWDQARQVRR